MEVCFAQENRWLWFMLSWWFRCLSSCFQWNNPMARNQALLRIGVFSEALYCIYSDTNCPLLEELTVLLPRSSSGVWWGQSLRQPAHSGDSFVRSPKDFGSPCSSPGSWSAVLLSLAQHLCLCQSLVTVVARILGLPRTLCIGQRRALAWTFCDQDSWWHSFSTGTIYFLLTRQQYLLGSFLQVLRWRHPLA